jgi:hypothetical protein
VTIIIPAPAGSPPKSTSNFVGKSICSLRSQYEERQSKCKNQTCYNEWQAKLDILNEEARNESE